MPDRLCQDLRKGVRVDEQDQSYKMIACEKNSEYISNFLTVKDLPEIALTGKQFYDKNKYYSYAKKYYHRTKYVVMKTFENIPLVKKYH